MLVKVQDRNRISVHWVLHYWIFKTLDVRHISYILYQFKQSSVWSNCSIFGQKKWFTLTFYLTFTSSYVIKQKNNITWLHTARVVIYLYLDTHLYRNSSVIFVNHIKATVKTSLSINYTTDCDVQKKLVSTSCFPQIAIPKNKQKWYFLLSSGLSPHVMPL